MFFISKGDVAILSANKDLLVVLGEGEFFGEIVLLIDTPRTASARAVGFVDLFALSKKDLAAVLEHFPDERPLLLELAETRIGHDQLRSALSDEPLFKKCNRQFLNGLSDAFAFKRFYQGHYLYRSGKKLDADTCIYVAHGTVDILDKEDHTIDVLTEGTLFGDLDLLRTILNITDVSDPTAQYDCKPRTLSLRVSSLMAVVFVLKRSSFVHVLSLCEYSDQLQVLQSVTQEALDQLNMCPLSPGQDASEDWRSINMRCCKIRKMELTSFLRKTPVEEAEAIAKAKSRSRAIEDKTTAMLLQECPLPAMAGRAHDPASLLVQNSLLTALFGTHGRTMSSLTPKETLVLLNTLASIQRDAIPQMGNVEAAALLESMATVQTAVLSRLHNEVQPSTKVVSSE